MTNRQARREQSRSSRNQRGQRGRSQRPSQPNRNGGGPGSFLSLPYLIGIGVFAVALAGILVYVALNTGGGDDEQVAALEALEEDFPADMADGLSVGDPDAPVTLVAYEDFTCPFCLNFTAEQEPDIMSEFVETGQVRFQFQHMPLRGQEATNAAEAAQCAAEQDSFWPMHHKLFLEHAREGNPSSGLYSTDAVKQYASDIDLDTEAFNTCVDNDETIETVNEHVQEGQSLGITGTPGFVINGQPISGGAPATVDGWREVLNAAIAEAEGEGGNGANGDEDANGADDSTDDEDGSEDPATDE